jgi:hypothetical protein
VSVKKLNESEPLMTCRKDNLLAKLLDPCTDRKTVTGNCLLVTGQPALRRQQPCTGFYTKRGRLFVDVQKALLESRKTKRETVRQRSNSSDSNSILVKPGDATNSVGRSHSSDEILRKQEVAKGSGYPVRSILEQPRIRRGRKSRENDKVITDQ